MLCKRKQYTEQSEGLLRCFSSTYRGVFNTSTTHANPFLEFDSFKCTLLLLETLRKPLYLLSKTEESRGRTYRVKSGSQLWISNLGLKKSLGQKWDVVMSCSCI